MSINLSNVDYLIEQAKIAEEGLLSNIIIKITDKLVGFGHNWFSLIGSSFKYSELNSYYKNNIFKIKQTTNRPYTECVNIKIPLPKFKVPHIEMVKFLTESYSTININMTIEHFKSSLKDIFLLSLSGDLSNVKSIDKALRSSVDFKKIATIEKVIELQYIQPHGGEVLFGNMFGSMRQFSKITNDMLAKDKVKAIENVNKISKINDEIVKMIDDFVIDIKELKDVDKKALSSALEITSKIIYNIGNVFNVYAQIIGVHIAAEHNIKSILINLKDS